jgi:ADP-ribose pyrophosphatase YjhB (NUDIX family)
MVSPPFAQRRLRLSHDGFNDGNLSPQDWEWASRHLPIACVDVLPVVRNQAGLPAQVGLIKRASPLGDVWCHIGGRVQYGETLATAVERHLSTTLAGEWTAETGTRPYTSTQYFPDARPGMGHDPRKHAIANCFYSVFAEPVPIAPIGEAIDFGWFDGDRIPWDALWPGTDLMIRELQMHLAANNDALTYEVVSARQVSHNELMWQTPALAMTAMAFLFTISLDDGGRGSARALAAFLGFLIALVSLQLMAKHSHHQRRDADLLADLENRREMMRVNQRPSTVKDRRSGRLRGWLPRPVAIRSAAVASWFIERRSRHWWMATLAGFGLVSAAVGLDILLGA